jgi:hypothetical protein
MPKKGTNKKRMIKAVAAALKAMENTVYETKDRDVRLKQVTEGLNAAGLDAKWDWGRIIFAGRDASGAGWVTVGLKIGNNEYDSIWPEWAYGIAENALHFNKWLEVQYNDQPFGENLLRVSCSYLSVDQNPKGAADIRPSRAASHVI